ncbi:hypothetical protein [Gemmata sp.]|uniref:hypothetical protein n=1 Tax=Gemmata sp. TaxID=1914242 RepID=UPI003F6E9327
MSSFSMARSAPHGTAGRAAAAFTKLCSIQGLYYLITGVWPLVSIETFQMVTGPKTDHLVTGRESDHWLVNTVGVLVTANALVLLLAAWRNRPTPEVALLAAGSAAGLIAIDVIYVARGVIPPVYLADAAFEAVLIAAWFWVAASGRLRPRIAHE